MRIALAALCAIALAAAAAFITLSEKTVAARRTALSAFDDRAREAVDALNELRAAQQAYVAVGQGTEFWIPKVDSTKQAIADALETLRQSAASPDALTAIETASTSFAEFGEVDRRIRNYLTNGAQLMAADIVFTEGGEAAVRAARSVEKARVFDRVAFDVFDAARRTEEIAAAGGAAALMLVTIVAFMRRASSALPDERSSSRAVDDSLSLTPPSSQMTDELPLRAHDWRPTPAQPGASIDPRTSGAYFKAVAELCTDIGRIGDLDQLRSLLGRTAQLLDASGLILWVASASGAELQPAIAHGYPPQTVARIPAVPYTADNAAAAAYRTIKTQIVPSRPGSSVKGAIVVPVVAVDGCIGVLSAELRGGGEGSDQTQATAAILAAQFASVIAASPAQDDGRAAEGIEVRG